jgi:hypothetical protein
MYYNWIKLNYLYFILVAIIGLAMRLTFLGLPAPYSHLLHTHSHTAFLGWIYPTLLILLINFFLDNKTINKHKFSLQIVITHMLVLAMFISFFIQGYGFYSILSSSLFQLVNYWFIFSFLKALKSIKKNVSVVSVSILKIALWALFISSFGPWAVGIIKAVGLAGSKWYEMAIYFYMHFLYNGWIIFALFALFFKYIEKQFDERQLKDARQFLIYMAYALVPGYFLSLLGMYKNSWIYSFSAISAIFQVQALYFLYRIVFHQKKYLSKILGPASVKIIAAFILLAFSLKTLLQLLSIIPDLGDLAFSSHNIIIAFIHLIMIGIVSSSLLVVLAREKILSLNSFFAKTGVFLFMMGFIGIEFILGFQFTLWLILFDANVLAAFTLCLALGVLFIFSGFFKTGKNK